MGKRKPGVTANRHVAIGASLSEARNLLVRLEVELGNAYPHSRAGQLLNSLRKARIALDDARSHGDSLSCGENPKLWCSHWYYPADWEKHGEMPHACGITQSEVVGTDADAIEQHRREHGTVLGPAPTPAPAPAPAPAPTSRS